MRLTGKLLDYLHGVFNKTPREFIAFRARHVSDAFRYVVRDFMLDGFDGDTQLFSADLNGHTLFGLAEFIGGQTGMSVTYLGDTASRKLSACVLLERSSAQINSNGDQFTAYSSLLWTYLDSLAERLAEARESVVAALDQMSIKTADDVWLDEWGMYFGVPRLAAETDNSYAQRIVIEVMRPRGNNKAIELALLEYFGQESSVIDLEKRLTTSLIHNGAYQHNNIIKYSATDDPYYGLFAVAIGYDIESSYNPLLYAEQIRQFINRFRDAGTHMESLRLTGSSMADAYAPEATTDTGHSAVVELVGWRGSDRSYDGTRYYDGGFSHDATVFGDYCDPPQEGYFSAETALSLADASDPASENGQIDVAYSTTHNGLRAYNGAVPYQSGSTVSAAL